jgi:predicted nucleic acid-binding protein
MRVVVNTSPLIALDRIGQLGLLKRLYGEVVRPQSVLDELLAGVDQHPGSMDLLEAQWIKTEPDPLETVMRRELGAGETAAIALAMRSGADLVVLDDLQARLVAGALGLRVTGTLGVLIAAHQSGLLFDLAGCLRHLREAGFRLPTCLVEQYGVSSE